MYTVWDVSFRIKTDTRGPCDPLFRTEPPARGSVGDANPFSDAFGRVLNNVEDSLRLRSIHNEQASSVTSDTSEFFSLRSPIIHSPLTPNTEQSISSRFEPSVSTSWQLHQQLASPNLDYYSREVHSSTLSPVMSDRRDITPNAPGDFPSTGENLSKNNISNTAAALSSVTTKPEPTNDPGQTPASTVRRKRKKKAPFSMTRRTPVKTREQHLSDNKAAASKCRQQRKAWEVHLQEMSVMLQASINASKSNINELGNELASLKRQVWECPDCTDRYVYSRGLGPTGVALKQGAADIADVSHNRKCS